MRSHTLAWLKSSLLSVCALLPATSIAAQHRKGVHRSLLFVLLSGASFAGFAQSAPSARDVAGYTALHAAAHAGDLAEIERLLDMPDIDLDERDGAGRTPLHVAAFGSHDDVLHRLAEAGGDLDALEGQAYDVVTLAAVANDVALLSLALDLGASAGNVTSPYDGTALIAAAHLGHAEVVRRLIEADAPLDHVNNLAWTALIEAIVLGDGGPDHVATVRALVEAGADRGIGDRQGVTPLEHARSRGYDEIVEILERRH